MQIKDGFKRKGIVKIPDEFDLNALNEEEDIEIEVSELEHALQLFVSFLNFSSPEKRHPQIILEIPRR